jgi:thiol-disulfide isomerase/thioredoxin
MNQRPFASLLAAALLLGSAVTTLAADTNLKAPKPETIANGAKIQLADHLVAGKTTVFEFTSSNCPACHALIPAIEKLHATRDDVAVVLININRPGAKGIDWDSPVSLQVDLPSTPQFKVYGPDGKLVAQGKPAYTLVTGWFK